MKENKSLELKGNSGITLIALVITIIVLIILAGISIAMISSQNGILTNASNAAVENAFGNAKDKIALLANESVHDVYQAVYVKNKGSASDIDALINATLEAKIYADRDEINKLLGITDAANGLEVIDAAGATVSSATVPTTLPTAGTDGNKITLKYSDGHKCVGTISAGVVTWGEITK